MYVVVSLNRGTQYRPQNIIVLIIGTPQKVRTPYLGEKLPQRYVEMCRVHGFGFGESSGFRFRAPS